MQKTEYDLLIIGAGPGGYVAAIRGAQLGLRVGVIERKRVGGVCLNEGCIPSKALIRNAEVLSLFRRGPEFGITFDKLKADFGVAVDRSQRAVKRLTKGVELLFKKNNIDLIKGTGRFLKPGEVQVIDSGGEEKKFTARNFIIASGTRGRPLPGLEVDHHDIITSDEALVMKNLPQSILIVGAGAGYRLCQSTFPLSCPFYQRIDVLWPVVQCGRVKICSVRPNKRMNFGINPNLIK